LHTLFVEIAQLIKSPVALFHPQVVLRVLGVIRLTDKIV